MSTLPTYRFRLGGIFPETLGVIEPLSKEDKSQCTDSSERKLAGLVLTVAYAIRNHNPPNELSWEDFDKELNAAAAALDTPVDRILDWAESIILPSSVTLTDEELLLVPTHNKAKGFALHEYQRKAAAWSARRLGSVLALGCGVGKTATSVAAAITAKRIRKTGWDRVYIICPLNAMPTWRKAVLDLKEWYKEVQIVSVDSLHKYKALTVSDGGALIIDECHKVKHEKTQRTGEALHIRRCFDWSVSLTGSLLNTGPEGIMTVLDLACPGLSRFMNKWQFGSAFKCLASKTFQQRGRMTKKQSLVIPGEESRPLIATYLEPAVRSLSFASPEVSSVVPMPGQTKVLVDSWEPMEWVKSLPATDEVYWAPTANWQVFMGGLAVAMMHETNETMCAVATECLGSTFTDHGLAWVALDEAVKNPLFKPPNPMGRPEFQVQSDWMSKRGDIEKLLKQSGLPSFPRLLHAACRFGRHDNVLVKRENVMANGLVVPDWRLLYGPGHSRLNPGAGPKCQFVFDWLEENKGEYLVCGAAGTATIDCIAAEFKNRGITHHIIRGGVSGKTREAYVDAFAAGQVQVMLVQQVAGSESVDLIRASTSILVDHDWSANTYTQFLARTHRLGQHEDCVHHDLAFGILQVETIAKLIRGVDFDSVTRNLLEKAYAGVS